MANYRYTADLIDSALFAANEATDGTSDYEAKALEYINRAYQSLIAGGAEFTGEGPEDWWWLKKTGILTLQPGQTGTMVATQDSAAITFDLAPAASLLGWYLKTDDADIYKIGAHTGGQTAATLDSPYNGESGSKNWEAFNLDYSLAADFVTMLDPLRAFRLNIAGEFRITSSDRDAMEQQWPTANLDEGLPTRFTMLDENTIHFNRSAPERMRVEYDYLYLPADLTNSGSEEPVVPFIHRKVLADICATYILNDKDDTKANNMGLIAKKGVEAMVAENRQKWSRTGKVGIIYPRQGRRTRSALRTATGTVFP